MMNRTAAGLAVLMLFAMPLPGQAEQSRDFDDYTVHYNAFTTDILSPDVAKVYGIQRSGNRGMLNVSILKEVMGTRAQPVGGRVEATATNLNAQLRNLDVREVTEQGAVYHIAEFKVENGETLKFDITFSPEDTGRSYSFSFSRQFFSR